MVETSEFATPNIIGLVQPSAKIVTNPLVVGAIARPRRAVVLVRGADRSVNLASVPTQTHAHAAFPDVHDHVAAPSDRTRDHVHDGRVLIDRDRVHPHRDQEAVAATAHRREGPGVDQDRDHSVYVS